MKTLVVHFDRIGRRHEVPDLEIVVDPEHLDRLHSAVRKYCGKHLVSREFHVQIDMDNELTEGVGSIDGGRFGTFTLKEKPSADAEV